LALELAERVDGEIVSVDALQAYRALDIGTAKPSAEERRRIPHYMIDICNPSDRLSAGRYAALAREAITQIRRRAKCPIIVGGSGLYMQAVLEGMSPIPPVDAAIRRRVRQRLEREGLESLRRQLAEQDPDTASRLEVGDTQRTLRALEVLLSTGRGLAEWQAEPPPKGSVVDARRFGLSLPREVLYERIEARVRSMLENGWLLEVKGLLDRGLDPRIPAFQAIGYRQLAAHIRGEVTLEKAVEDTVRATRRYAKRQGTWFRRMSDVKWFSMREPNKALDDLLCVLGGAHLGGENG